MNHIKCFISFLFLVPLLGFSQTTNETSTKEASKKNRPTYRGISLGGLGIGSFRDFATSPLTYSGISLSSSRFKLKIDQARETQLGSALAIGFYGNTFNDHFSQSIVISPSIYYSELYEIKRFSSEKLNVKAGGMIDLSANVRINPDLNNNAVGYELIPTLFGSAKGTLDVSRNVDRYKKFLFFKYHLLKRTKKLALRFNVGLVNSSYRNGYVYSGQSFLLNDSKLFDGYQFKVFSGFRMSSSLDYTLYSRKNSNAVQFSYVWDAYTTGGNFDTFEMAQHALRFTLLFNTN
ncbi:MAG: hypothetical protein WBM83_15620 [Flavobacteriaceae bacterium]